VLLSRLRSRKRAVTKLLVSWGPPVIAPPLAGSLLAPLRCAGMPSDFATFKIPTPFASHLPLGRAVDLRSAELHALGDGALETCFYSLADHAPLKFSKGAPARWTTDVSTLITRSKHSIRAAVSPKS